MKDKPDPISMTGVPLNEIIKLLGYITKDGNVKGWKFLYREGKIQFHGSADDCWNMLRQRGEIVK